MAVGGLTSGQIAARGHRARGRVAGGHLPAALSTTRLTTRANREEQEQRGTGTWMYRRSEAAGRGDEEYRRSEAQAIRGGGALGGACMPRWLTILGDPKHRSLHARPHTHTHSHNHSHTRHWRDSRYRAQEFTRAHARSISALSHARAHARTYSHPHVHASTFPETHNRNTRKLARTSAGAGRRGQVREKGWTG